MNRIIVAFAAAALAGGFSSAQDDVETDPAADTENWREVDAENLLIFETTKGRILVETLPRFAPNHVARIKELIREDYYDGIIFHRVIEGFMAQTGDPTGMGTGATGQKIDAEFEMSRGADTAVAEVHQDRTNRAGFYKGVSVITQPEALRFMTADQTVKSWITHCPGVVSMARGTPRNSADAQFFFVRGDARMLDQQYTAWGHVVEGLDVVKSLNLRLVPGSEEYWEAGPRERGDETEPDEVNLVRVAADVPDDRRPRVWVMREAGPAYEALIAQAREAQGDFIDVCEIQIPSIVQDPET